MISVSTIKSYMFCPLKLYFQSNIDEKTEEDYFTSKTLKDLRMDIQDLFLKNLRHIKKDMEEEEVEKRLAIGINNLIKTTFDIVEEINENKRNKETEENEENDGNKENKENKETRIDNGKLNNAIKNDEEIEFIDQNKINKIFEKENEEESIED